MTPDPATPEPEPVTPGPATPEPATPEPPTPASWPRLPRLDGADAPVITGVRTFVTAPDGINLVVVRVETDQPGLYGLGCATFTQRAQAVRVAVDEYLAPQLIGRGAADLPDIHAAMHVSGYWRNGPIMNNALSGIDIALWDLLGKSANLPVWQLLGGRARIAVPAYAHAGGADVEEAVAHAQQLRTEGYRHIRLQSGVAGSAGYGAAGGGAGATLDNRHQIQPTPFEAQRYIRTVVALLAAARTHLGDDVELIHDVHSRLTPPEAVQLARAVEPYRLFFLEDPLAIEDLGWLPRLRAQSCVPIGIGELFTHGSEYVPLLRDGLIDFVRCHVSAIGGVSPARKLASAAELFGVQTAWHGPGDVSPVGHAANIALGIASPNTGVQERHTFGDRAKAVFPGTPEARDGYLWPWTTPGFGVEFVEREALRHPAREPNSGEGWTQLRRPDGTAIRP